MQALNPTSRRDAQQAFADAIANGIMTSTTAGDYMYMWSAGIQDVFKHRDTRDYLNTDYAYSTEG